MGKKYANQKDMDDACGQACQKSKKNRKRLKEKRAQAPDTGENFNAKFEVRKPAAGRRG